MSNAFFVAGEFALVGARRTLLDEMARASDRKARLAQRAVQSLTRYISTTQLGITEERPSGAPTLPRTSTVKTIRLH